MSASHRKPTLKIQKKTIGKIVFMLIGIGLVAGFVVWSGVSEVEEGPCASGLELGMGDAVPLRPGDRRDGRLVEPV